MNSQHSQENYSEQISLPGDNEDFINLDDQGNPDVKQNINKASGPLLRRIVTNSRSKKLFDLNRFDTLTGNKTKEFFQGDSKGMSTIERISVAEPEENTFIDFINKREN